MSARDDYARLHANTSGPHHQGQTSREAQAALNEIDALRAVETVADRVRSIADTADRPGVYRLLHEIADELDVEPCEWCHGNRPPANVVAPPCHRCHGTGGSCPKATTTPENVECQTCGGLTITGHPTPEYPYYTPCPDCTPESVDCRTCGGTGEIVEAHGDSGFDVTDCWVCDGTGSTPENVEEPTVTDQAVSDGAT